jgi:hypothetical protein
MISLFGMVTRALIIHLVEKRLLGIFYKMIYWSSHSKHTDSNRLVVNRRSFWPEQVRLQFGIVYVI